jgi:hypothetical protein
MLTISRIELTGLKILRFETEIGYFLTKIPIVFSGEIMT